MAGISVDLTFGPIHVACKNAALSLSQAADVVFFATLYCSDSEVLASIENLRDYFSMALNVPIYEDFVEEHNDLYKRSFGTTIKSILDNLDNKTMDGHIQRVSLFAWLDIDENRFISLSAARHPNLDGALSYELGLSWILGCLNHRWVERYFSREGLTDRARAQQMQDRLAEICGDAVNALTSP